MHDWQAPIVRSSKNLHSGNKPQQHWSLLHNLFIFVQLGVVNLTDLCQLATVVRVLNGILSSSCSQCCLWYCRRPCTTFLRSNNTLGKQHVVEPKQLWVRRLIVSCTADAKTWITDQIHIVKLVNSKQDKQEHSKSAKSAKAEMSTESESGIKSRFPD